MALQTGCAKKMQPSFSKTVRASFRLILGKPVLGARAFEPDPRFVRPLLRLCRRLTVAVVEETSDLRRPNLRIKKARARAFFG